ncbi:MAG: helix-turn-helix transcriptional regulator [Gammaproteobacteria bacterium]|nr:helix-turn-helix transcriptional regulator [Gammaproteobacteria bacterium]
MVCMRCIKVVKEEISKLGFQIKNIELGKVELSKAPNEAETQTIKQILLENGFELIDDKKSRIIAEIKTVIIELVHYNKEKAGHINFSDFIANEVGYDYSYLSNLFSSIEGATIEKYIINQKTEKVKELLVYDELTLNEIAWEMGYSSVQHLSGQFKKITGLSPSHFKKVKEIKRKPLDKV